MKAERQFKNVREGIHYSRRTWCILQVPLTRKAIAVAGELRGLKPVKLLALVE
jgi:hypothetical protein